MIGVGGLKIVSMSAGHEEARGEGTAPVRPVHPHPSPLPSRERGTDPGVSHQEKGGDSIVFRAWDFWVRRSWMLWVLAVVVLLLDQSTKSVIVAWLDWGQSWPDEGFLRITHARNTGTAFSLFQGHNNVLSFVALLAVGVLLWVYATTGAKSFVLRLALGLQLGGALGNLLDRLQQGYVTDFLDVGPWPIFNVADSASRWVWFLMVWYFFTAREEDVRSATKVSSGSQALSAGCVRCAEAMRHGTLNRVVSGGDSPT